ncbi:MAG: DUF350 domain-containing protein [Alphaproteobacteria bacterium]
MLSTLPLYLAYVATSVGLMVVFVAIYMHITPYRELALIRAGNRTAAVSLGGVLIGFGLTLASTAAHSVGILDLALWGAIALVCQVAVYFVATFLLKDLKDGIESDRLGFGLLLAAMSITMGLINAGALTY